jgi:excisionase family DNA binding protein
LSIESIKKLLSIDAVAEYLDISRQTATRMILEGALPAILLRSGRRKKVWRVRPEALESWLKEREGGTRQRKVEAIRP